MADDTLYNREPIGIRVVDIIPDESWQLVPIVYETLDDMDKEQA